MATETYWYQKITRHLLQAFLGHIRILFYDLDCVKDQSIYRFTREDLLFYNSSRMLNIIDDETNNMGSKLLGPRKKGKPFNGTYFFPFLLALYIAFDEVLIWTRNGFAYDPTRMEQLFTHLVFPKSFWPQADIMFGLAISMSATVFPLLLLDPMLDRKYWMYLFFDRKSSEGTEILTHRGAYKLPPDETARIVAFRKKARPFIAAIMITLTVQVESFTLWNLWNHWTSQNGHLYIMALCVVLFCFYGNFSNLFMLFYFGLTVHYIAAKQISYQKRVARLALKVDGRISGLPDRTKTSTIEENPFIQAKNILLWRHFSKVNSQSAVLYEEIAAQNDFWSKYLSIYFAVYIVEIVYLTYCIFFIDTSSLGVLQLFFPLFAVNFTFNLVLVTLECSKIVSRNCRVHRQTERLLVQFQLIHSLSVSDLMKVDAMAYNYQNVPRVCFKMINNYQINSQMFQLVRYIKNKNLKSNYNFIFSYFPTQVYFF